MSKYFLTLVARIDQKYDPEDRAEFSIAPIEGDYPGRSSRTSRLFSFPLTWTDVLLTVKQSSKRCSRADKYTVNLTIPVTVGLGFRKTFTFKVAAEII